MKQQHKPYLFLLLFLVLIPLSLAECNETYYINESVTYSDTANYTLERRGAIVTECSNEEWYKDGLFLSVTAGYLLIMIGMLFLMHTFKEARSSIVVYSIISGVLSLFYAVYVYAFYGTIVTNFQYYLIAFVVLFALYLFVVSRTFYQDIQNE